MPSLLQVVRSLGNAGAVSNAGALASERRREEWVVAALSRSTAGPGARAAPTAKRRTA